jgi:predicted ATPase
MTPQQKYQQDLLRPGFVADPAQGMAISRLERLYQDLLRRPTPTRSRGLLGWLQKPKPPEPVLGIYMWGGVGRGKTWLMDTFFDSLPGERKLVPPTHQEELRKILRQKRSAVLHQMQLLGINTADWDKVNAFCLDSRIAGMEFRELDCEALDTLQVKLRAIRRKRENKQQ